MTPAAGEPADVSPPDPPGGPAIAAAVRATYTAFGGSGFAFASWASRIPQVRDRLGLTPSGLGLVLLAVAAGSILALPAAGPVVTRLGAGRTVRLTSLLFAVALAGAGVGHLAGVGPLIVALFLLGLANGGWDVAMNVHGAAVERRLGRSVMPRFHAGWSLGTVAGAGVGALAVAAGVPVAVHLTAVGLLVAAVVPAGVRAFVRTGGEPDPGPRPGRGRSAWAEPRTLLVGVFVLAFAFAEGTANDWVTIAFLDGHGVSPGVGTLGFAAFLAAMTAVRWVGPRLLDRHGRVAVVRATSAVAVAGLVLFVVAPTTPLAFAGVLLWGGGVSLGFPVGMSAGADDPERAAARVSVIASIGYVAFLGGPPLIGLLGQRFGVLRALPAVAVLLAVAALLAGVVRPGHRRRAVR